MNDSELISPSVTIDECTLDDLLQNVLVTLQKKGHTISPSKGTAKEIIGATLRLHNPLARLSRSEQRGRPFSCFGELLWYLAGDDSSSFIRYYIPNYPHKGEKCDGAYGPRLIQQEGVNQIQGVIATIQRRCDSRRALIQLLNVNDLSDSMEEMPCTCTLQFFAREGKLHLNTFMRSNDVIKGLPHDIFAFTFIQELVARSTGLELGAYTHMVGSLHYYESDRDKVNDYIEEGFQSVKPMAQMPIGDPWQAIEIVLNAEKQFRIDGTYASAATDGMDAYWRDIINLLYMYRQIRDKNKAGIERARSLFSTRYFDPYVNRLTSKPTI